MAEQSWYIKKYIEYMMHPKRFEYEAKNEKIKFGIDNIIGIANIGAIAVCVIIAAVNFFNGFEHSDVVTGFFVPLGIALAVRFIVMPLLFELSDGLIKTSLTMVHKKDLSALENEYYDKYGLTPITLERIYKNKCGELDDRDNWICSATGERISYRKVCECHRDGCRNCQVLSDVLYNSIDWDVVNENERKFEESKRLKKEKAKEAYKQKKMVGNTVESGYNEWLQQPDAEKKSKKSIEEIIEIVIIVIGVISAIVWVVLEIFF